MLTGFLNYDMNTIIMDEDQVPLTVQEWLLTIPDYRQFKLFTAVQEISDTTLEIQTLNSNFSIAMKWFRHYKTHISQVLYTTDIEHTFQQTDDINNDVETWEPPPQPTITFYKSTHTKSNPKTITSSSKHNKLNTSSTKTIDFDNQTTATTNTAQSTPSQN
jgi:hypothetical protein